MLSLIAGDASVLGSTNINHRGQKQKLLRQIHRLPADFVVLDLGGDTSFNTLDFFLFADHRLVVTTADPASVLDAYSFIKVALLRRLAQYVGAEATRPDSPPPPRRACGASSRTAASPARRTCRRSWPRSPALDPEAASAVAGILREVRPRLVLNLSDPTAGKEIIERIRDACQQHLPHRRRPLSPRARGRARGACHAADHQRHRRRRRRGGRAGRLGLRHQARAPGERRRGAGAHGAPSTVRRRFFDPPAVFARLARLLDDPFRRAHVRGESVDAFVVAADAGETAYSVAIALEDAARRTPGVPYHVWAGGVLAANIEAARRGVYPHVFLGALRAETLRNHFLRGTGLSEGFSAVKDGVRRTVTFVDGPALDHVPSSALARSRLHRREPRDARACRRRGEAGRARRRHRVEARDAPVPGVRRLDESIYQVVERPQSHRSVA